MPWLGTFHAICVKMLRRHAELVELKSSFTILDTDDQIRLIKQILEAENIDTKRWPPRLFASMLDRWKNKALGPRRVPPDECGFANGRGAELYQAYQDRLRVLNAVDFGDLLLHVVTILQTNRTCWPTTRTASATSSSTSTRTPTSRSTCSCACSPPATATSAASATTTSRSMAGAAPRSATS